MSRNALTAMTILSFALTTLLVCPLISARAEEHQNTLTHGNVQMTLKVGSTTQLQVVEAFGSPNITTLDGEGREVWVYHRHATVERAENNSFSIGLGIAGGDDGVGAAGGAGYKKSRTGFEESTRQMTLIIKFDAKKIVSDFKSRESSF